MLFVVNKVDLPHRWTPNSLPTLSDFYVCVSAQAGTGLDELIAAITNRLVPNPPQPGEAVPFTPHLCETVLALHHAIVRSDWQSARSYAVLLNNP